MAHNKTINHLIIALAALQDGDVEEAQEALTDAVSQPDFDEALEVLDEVQEGTFDGEEEMASDEVEDTVVDALSEEEGVDVDVEAGVVTMTLAGVRNARRAVRVIKTMASVEDAEEVDEEEVPEEIAGEFAHVIKASIDGEDVLIGVNEDGSAEVMSVEDEEADVDEEEGLAPTASRRARRKTTASAEDFDSWDEDTEEDDEENLAPTASVRRSRQSARRRATVAGLNFNVIARNKRSI